MVGIRNPPKWKDPAGVSTKGLARAIEETSISDGSHGSREDRLGQRILGLTLHQPWAFAIAHAGKRVENRSWRPWCAVGTYLAIHAGASLDREAVRTLAQQGIHVPPKFEQGAIVAVAQLAGVAHTDTQVPEEQLDWWCGPIGWLLDEVVAIEPVPCKGAQGLWRLPDEVLGEVRRRFLANKGRP